MSKPFTWSHDDRYDSNDASGPYEARIVGISETGMVVMERHNRGTEWGPTVKGSCWARFMLTPETLQSDWCGWKKRAER